MTDVLSRRYNMQPVRRSSRRKPIPPISRTQAHTDQHYQDIIHVAVTRAQQVCRMTSPIIPHGGPVAGKAPTKLDRPIQIQSHAANSTPISKLNTVPIRPKPSFGALMPAKPTATASKTAGTPAGSLPNKTISNIVTDLRRTNPVLFVDDTCFQKPPPVIHKPTAGPPVKPLSAIPLKSPRPFVASTSGTPSGWPSPSTVGNLQHSAPPLSAGNTSANKPISGGRSHLQYHRDKWPVLTQPESSERMSSIPARDRQGQVADKRPTSAFWIEDYNRAPRCEPYIPNAHPGILSTGPPACSPLPYKVAMSGEKYFPGEASLPAFRTHFTPTDLKPRPIVASPPPSAPFGKRPLPLFGQPQYEYAASREVPLEKRV